MLNKLVEIATANKRNARKCAEIIGAVKIAVVASEVKNLANQTARATEGISQLVGAIQGATSDTVSAIQSIGKTIGKISEISTAVASSVDEQRGATQEIARNVQEAAKGTHEVSSSTA